MNTNLVTYEVIWLYNFNTTQKPQMIQYVSVVKAQNSYYACQLVERRYGHLAQFSIEACNSIKPYDEIDPFVYETRIG